jgi:hypothetical protein
MPLGSAAYAKVAGVAPMRTVLRVRRPSSLLRLRKEWTGSPCWVRFVWALCVPFVGLRCSPALSFSRPRAAAELVERTIHFPR